MAKTYTTTLKKHLEDRAINQVKLAEKLGINATMFNRIVNGKYLPNLRTAQKIAYVLNEEYNMNLTVNDLWTYKHGKDDSE